MLEDDFDPNAVTIEHIYGSGGGKFGGSKNTSGGEEAPNNLKSKQVARLIDLLSEGPIKGVVGGSKGIYFDGVVVQRSDGSFNFKDASIQFVNGYPAQAVMSGFKASEAEESVGLQLKYGLPVTRNIINTDIDRVRITVSVPALQKFEDDGDIKGSKVEFRISVSNNGGGYQSRGDYTIQGKTNSQYQRGYTLTLPRPGPWDIRLQRLTKDSDSTKLQNDLMWDSFSGIIDDKVNYSNSACVGTIIDAEQFQQIPKRVYDVEGLLINYPENMDPLTGVYTGAWSGKFKFGYCNNPAWCLYDMIVNNRYGIGDYILTPAEQAAKVPPAMVDKASFYKAGVWCDGRVYNTKTKAYERRWTLNVRITDQREAFDLLMQMSAVFRGFTYWNGVALVLVADQPDDPSFVFTNANVVDGTFTYSGSDYRQRHTVATVEWQDPSQLGETRQAITEDEDAKARFGILPINDPGFGITRESQALRQGRWTIYTEQYEDDQIKFVTGMEGAYMRPGDICKIMDATVAGRRRGGRCAQGTEAYVVYFDAPVTVTAGVSYVISMVIDLGDATDAIVQTRATVPVDADGAVDHLDLVSNFSQAPHVGQAYVITTPTLEATLWRALTITQSENDRYEVSGVRHYPEKWNYVEKNIAFSEPDISDIVPKPPAVTNPKVVEYITQTSAISLQVMATFSWTSVSPLFDVWYRKVDDNWTHIRTDQHAINLPVNQGVYEFQVSPISSVGLKGPLTQLSYTVIGLSEPPTSPRQLRVNVIEGVALFDWLPATEIDMIVGGHYELRFSPKTTGAEWNVAQIVIPSIPGSATSAEANYQTGTWMLRAYDIENRPSPEWSTVIALAADLRYVEYYRVCENPDWTGMHEGTAIQLPQNWLVIGDSGGLWDDQVDDVSAWTEIDLLPSEVERPPAESGTYTFSNYLDAGAPFSVRLSADILAFPFFQGAATVDDRSGLVDTWANWDDTESGLDGQVVIQIRATMDDPNSPSAVWTEWKRFIHGEHYARAWQFRAVLLAPAGQNIGVEELCITGDFRNKIDAGENVDYAAEETRVFFRIKFFLIPAVVITVQNGRSTDSIEIINKTREYFDVKITDELDVPLIDQRTFDWHAQGY